MKGKQSKNARLYALEEDIKSISNRMDVLEEANDKNNNKKLAKLGKFPFK